MQRLVKIYKAFIFILPAVLFFSYYPIISLGKNETMNFELSLPLIWLVLFDILSFVLLLAYIKPKRDYFGISDRNFFFLALFPFYSSLSIFWAENKIRAVLTSGIIWLLFFAIFSIVFLSRHIIANDEEKTVPFRKKLLKSFVVSSVIIAVWCWIQSILDIAGVCPDYTLMCKGCVTNIFGFPHPNGFAIEPQFMGNLLIAPSLYEAYLFLKKPDRKNTILLVLFLATLFLTLSRGAIFAAAIAIIFMTIMRIIKTKTAKPLFVVLPSIIAAVVTLNAQGIFAELSPTDDTYYSGISKSINQLSLGIIKLPTTKSEEVQKEDLQESDDHDTNVRNVETQEVEIQETETRDTKNESNALETPVEKPEKEKAMFDGYIQESTDARVKMTRYAVEVWRSSPKNIFLGVGLGGAGVALNKQEKIPNINEIIQNEYASLLLEQGVLGLVCLSIGLIMIIVYTAKNKNRELLFGLFIAYGITLFFFSGLPNALHIYLLPAYFMFTLL